MKQWEITRYNRTAWRKTHSFIDTNLMGGAVVASPELPNNELEGCFTRVTGDIIVCGDLGE